jgi:hypothetical protein
MEASMQNRQLAPSEDDELYQIEVDFRDADLQRRLRVQSLQSMQGEPDRPLSGPEERIFYDAIAYNSKEIAARITYAQTMNEEALKGAKKPSALKPAQPPPPPTPPKSPTRVPSEVPTFDPSVPPTPYVDPVV